MMKGTMIIDGKKVEFNGEKNVLEVVRKAGIELPTFCFHSELSVYGACRMCIVRTSMADTYLLFYSTQGWHGNIHSNSKAVKI